MNEPPFSTPSNNVYESSKTIVNPETMELLECSNFICQPRSSAMSLHSMIRQEAIHRIGIPDIVCCYKGRFVAIELKDDEGVQSLLQKKWPTWK